MRNIFVTLSAVLLAFGALVSGGSVYAQSYSHYENYLSKFCSSVRPPSNCGSYQMSVNLANTRVNEFLQGLQSYNAVERQAVIRETQRSMENIINNYPESETKFLAVYYHVRLTQAMNGGGLNATNSLIGYFFGDTTTYYTNSNTNYSYSTNTYTNSRYADGEIDNVWSTSRYTVVNNSNKRITLRDNTLSLGIRALGWDGGVASKNADYQVVAVLDSSSSRYDDRTYNATYNTSSNYWTLRASIGSYSPRGVTLYLLSPDGDGARFNEGSAYRDWYVVDKVTYSVSKDRYYSSSNNYNDYYDDDYYDYYDDDYYYYDDDEYCDSRYYYCDDDYYYDGDRRSDLGVKSLRYDWDYDGSDVEIELTAVIYNYGRFESRVNDFDIHIEVDGDTIRSNEYDLDIVDVDCDGYRSRDTIELVSIDAGDQCEVILNLTFDRDDVEDEYIEIEVDIDAHGDNYNSNDQRVVRFRVD